MKKITLFILFSFFYLTTHAQSNIKVVWKQQVADVTKGTGAKHVIRDNQGNYLLGGFTAIPQTLGTKHIPWHESKDVKLWKYTPQGTLLWEKTFEGEPYHDGIYQMLACRDNGYLLATRNDVKPAKGSGLSLRSKLYKLNKDGQVLWSKKIGTENYEWYATTVAETKDGGFVVAGVTFYSFGASNKATRWLMKLDKNGKQQWMKKAKKHVSKATRVYKIFVTDKGEFLQFTQRGDNWDKREVYFVKNDAQGNETFTKEIKGLSKDRQYLYQVVAMGKDKFVLLAPGKDYYEKETSLLVVVNAQGTVLQKMKTNPGRAVSQVVYLPNQGFFTFGRRVFNTYKKTWWLNKFDWNGKQAWEETFPAKKVQSNYIWGACPGAEGELIFLGSEARKFSKIRKFFLMKVKIAE